MPDPAMQGRGPEFWAHYLCGLMFMYVPQNVVEPHGPRGHALDRFEFSDGQDTYRVTVERVEEAVEG